MLECIEYEPGFVVTRDESFLRLWNELDWERRGLTPRREYYHNTTGAPYTYGRGVYARTYPSKESHCVLDMIKERVEEYLGCPFEVAFLNGYETSRDQLGWHADDSPTMDSKRPIAIVTLGAEREIWFRPKENKLAVSRLLLEHGSLCVMKAGMQETHFHRIPKGSYDCGPRLSITFRGYVAPI